MKKKQLIGLIQENINGGSTTPDILKKAHPLVVEQYVNMAFNTIFYNIFRSNPEELDIYGRWYYSQEVKKDDHVYYCDLPCGTIQLPSNSASVRRITMTGDEYSVVFLNARTSANGVLNRLGTIARADAISYAISNRITFDEFDSAITKVNIFAITPFSDMGKDDDIPIPSGKDIEFLQTIFQLMQDKANDLKVNNNGN